MKKIFLFIVIFFSPPLWAEDWITEEVLKQLTEVRQELKALQGEVKDLRETLANQPSDAVQPSVKEALSVDISNAPYIGSDDAELVIVEFSDYQCPYCQRHFKQTLPIITKDHVDSGSVKYVMKQFPLGFHAEARGASIAALCVEKMSPGDYWKAHEAIFSGETKLIESEYLELANKLNIEKEPYQTCLNDPAMSEVVDQDMSDGTLAGVSGTPAFVIGKVVDGKIVNGKLLTGARPYASFKTILNQLTAE